MSDSFDGSDNENLDAISVTVLVASRFVPMAFEGRSECTVHVCGSPCFEGANLCQDHFVPCEKSTTKEATRIRLNIEALSE